MTNRKPNWVVRALREGFCEAWDDMRRFIIPVLIVGAIVLIISELKP